MDQSPSEGVTKRKRGGRPKTDAHAIAVRQDHQKWLERRTEGYSFSEIAEEYGVTKSAVHQAVTRILAEMPVEAAEEYRRVESLRLERQMRRLEKMAVSLQGEEGYAQVEAVLLKNSERRCKLLGLDLPVTKAANDDQTVDIEELRKLLNAVGFEVVPMTQVVEAK